LEEQCCAESDAKVKRQRAALTTVRSELKHFQGKRSRQSSITIDKDEAVVPRTLTLLDTTSIEGEQRGLTACAGEVGDERSAGTSVRTADSKHSLPSSETYIPLLSPCTGIEPSAVADSMHILNLSTDDLADFFAD